MKKIILPLGLITLLVATINGNKAPVEKAEPIFRSVNIPPGSGQVVFSYQPDSLKLGMP